MADFVDPGAFRAWIRGLSGAEKRAFAQKMGVTPRTVQRWAIEPGTGKEARSFLPSRLLRAPAESWPVGFKQRFNTAEVIRNGMSREFAPGLPTRTFTERFSNIRDALRYMKGLATGDADRWIQEGWKRARIKQSGDGFEVEVEYAGGGGTYAGGGSLGEGDLLPPDGLLDTPGIDDPFGDILALSYGQLWSREETVE